jgi:hypothetical protein
MIAGGLAQWRQRIKMATPAELASIDQQMGATHPLRPLITEEVVTRAQVQSGVGPEPQPVPEPSPEFEPQQLPMTSAVVTPPAVPDIPIPSVPQPGAPGNMAPVPAFYNQGDQQTVRETGVMMDRIGAASGEVIRDVGGAVRGMYQDYGHVVSNVVDTAGQIVDEWGGAANAAYDKWMPRLVDAGGELAGDIRATLTGTGYPEPPVNSTLDVQTGASGASPETRPGMMGALMGPQPGMEIRPPAAPYTLALPDLPGAPATAAAATPSPAPAPAAVPGGPPPPADPSPLSHVAVPSVKRKPDIPVKAPPPQTTKSQSPDLGGPSAAEALNRFYADQYRQGRIPGAPATVEDARTMAGMGDLKGAYR